MAEYDDDVDYDEYDDDDREPAAADDDAGCEYY